MSRIAYVNGRYLPRHAATVHIEDRGYQFSDGVYEVCEVRGGRLVDERLHIARLDALARRTAHRHADVDCRARCGHARNRAPQPRARRHRLSADHPRRGAARSRLSAARHGAERGGDCPQSRFRRQRENGGGRHRGHHGAGQPLGARRHQVGVAPAQRARQAGRPRTGREGGLVRGPCREGNGGILDQCLDRHPWTARW